MRAVIWAAVSSEPQAERVSLEQQEAEARAWCEAQGHEVRGVLSVPGHTRGYVEYSQAAADIPAYRELRRLLEERAFDVLVARSPDRLGRTAGLVHQVAEYCRLAGARIHFLNLPLTGNASVDNYILGIGGASAQNEIQELRRRTREGMNGRAHRGLPVASSLTFPYTRTLTNPLTGRPTGKAVLDPSGKAALREVLAMLERGESMANCARYLTALGYRTARGKPWYINSLRYLLRNTFLVGVVTRRSGGEVIEAAGQHEPVFTKEEWARLQALVARPGRGRRFGSAHGIWSGILVCGWCGYHLVSCISTHAGNPWIGRGYCCGGYRRNVCEHYNYVSERRITRGVVAAMQENLRQELAGAVQELRAAGQDSVPDTSAAWADLERRKKQVYLAWEDGGLTLAEYRARRKELDALGQVLEAQDRQAEAQREARAQRPARLMAWQELIALLPVLAETEDKRALNARLRRALTRVVVRDKEIVEVM